MESVAASTAGSWTWVVQEAAAVRSLPSAASVPVAAAERVAIPGAATENERVTSCDVPPRIVPRSTSAEPGFAFGMARRRLAPAASESPAFCTRTVTSNPWPTFTSAGAERTCTASAAGRPTVRLVPACGSRTGSPVPSSRPAPCRSSTTCPRPTAWQVQVKACELLPGMSAEAGPDSTSASEPTPDARSMGVTASAVASPSFSTITVTDSVWPRLATAGASMPARSAGGAPPARGRRPGSSRDRRAHSPP